MAKNERLGVWEGAQDLAKRQQSQSAIGGDFSVRQGRVLQDKTTGEGSLKIQWVDGEIEGGFAVQATEAGKGEMNEWLLWLAML